MNASRIARTLLVSLVTSTLALGFALNSASADDAQTPPTKKILFFTKSSGYEHDVISWKNGKPSLAEKVLQELAKKNNWELTFSKDGSLFNKDYLAQFDAFFFYTTGNLCEPGSDHQPAISHEGKQALLDAIEQGKGFVGTHAAADTFHTPDANPRGGYINHGDKADPYVRMIGGEFIKHDAQQKATMKCIDPKFPGMDKIDGSFNMVEEWYSLKDFSENDHVLLVQETSGMKGPDYQRPPYPATWARMQGKGRVFYTSMGHRDDVWTNPLFQHILSGGINWAVKNVDADVSPNLDSAAPKAMQNPKG